VFGDELANGFGLGCEFGLWSATATRRRQRPGFAVALQESANERRADGESFGYLGGGFAGLSSLENANAKVV
jgi:hypothetical protein